MKKLTTWDVNLIESISLAQIIVIHFYILLRKQTVCHKLKERYKGSHFKITYHLGRTLLALYVTFGENYTVFEPE